MIRRIAFFGGLTLGSSIFAFLFGAFLTFMLTGKVLAFQTSKENGTRIVLVTPDTFYESPAIVEEER